FLFGARGDERTREAFTASPVHARTGGAFLIARTEVTIGDWLEFVAAQPVAEQAKLLPHIAPKVEGGVSIDKDGERWRLTYQPVDHAYVVAWNEPIVYAGRTKHVRQDWRRFPISGISARDAEAYTAWLDRSGRVPGARLCDETE